MSSDLRKLHNEAKRQLIVDWVKPNSYVLDCGCGRGGDWWKWKAVKARVAAIDPDEESLKEAESRAIENQIGVWFLGVGDIRDAVSSGPYDVVCYNFSIHYIFESKLLFDQSIKAIVQALKPGGILIGITPTKSRAEAIVNSESKFIDDLGNEIHIKGDRLMVKLSDGPFYANAFKEEPLLDESIFIQKLEEAGMEPIAFGPMLSKPSGRISDLYSKFVFRKSSKG
jgi:SAM-dependent methyltransferase